MKKQDVGQTKGGTATGERTGAPARRASDPLSPVQAFLFVLALLAIAGLAIYFTTGGGAPAPVRLHESRSAVANDGAKKVTEEQGSRTLSDVEAVETFRRLDRRLLRAYRKRNIHQLNELFTDNSPMAPKAIAEIRQLRRDNVLLEPNSRIKSVVVQDKTSHRIVVREVVVFDFQFFNDAGEDVTQGRRANIDTVRRVLKLQDERWRLHTSRVLKRDFVRSSHKP